LKAYKRTSSTTNKSIYVSYRNKLKSVLVAAERSYYSAQFAFTSASMKDTWRIISKIINVSPKASLPPFFATCAGDVSDPIIIANKFNNYFSKVGSTLSNQIGETHVSIFDSLPPSCAHSAFFEGTYYQEVLGIIKALKNTMSVGVDDIPISVISFCSDVLCVPIASLFNDLLVNGCFPNLLKVGKVIPVYKSGERNNFTNYRPISLLTNFSNI